MSAGRPKSRPVVDAFLNQLTRTTLVVGKGGVGKTTCAVGIAVRFAVAGETSLLVSTDPAGSLGPAVGVRLAQGKASRVDAVRGLWALQLDPAAARAAFLGRWRDVLVTIMDRGTYLDAADIEGLVDAAFPGADEIFGLLVLADLLGGMLGVGENEARVQRVVVDTAPTGHTLRLLGLPETFHAMIALLESMQAKHRFMVQALTHRYRRDIADEFLDQMRRTIAILRNSFGDERQLRAVVVTRAEPVVMSETLRYAEALRNLRISLAAVVMEALPAILGDVEKEALASVRAIGEEGAIFLVPAVDPPPAALGEMTESLGRMVRLDRDSYGESGTGAGEPEVRDEGKWLRADEAATPSLNSGGAHRAGVRPDAAPPTIRLLRTLTIVGGKGGVGKTTVACALALSATLDDSADAEILLVSTDPAPSLADALGVATRRWAYDSPEPVTGVPRLFAWQMDAAAAFESLRDRYREHIDTLFDRIMGRSVDIVHDRAVIRDLLSLAPPGIDELYALASLGDALAERRYARIIVDPAPTGHLLRLLELPAIAIDWSHRLMRLIMKYKDITGLADAAGDLVNFSRRTRTLDTLLHDATRAGVVLVTLNEPAVIAETTRLASALQRVTVGVLGEIWNRVESEHGVVNGGQALRAKSASNETPIIQAPEHSGPLVGVEVIRAWSRHWMLRPPRASI